MLPVKYQQLLAQGSQALSQRDYTTAERRFTSVLRNYPRHMEANFFLGTLYAQTERYGEAIKHLGRALQQQPNSLQIINNLANVHRFLGNLEEAQSLLEQALTVDPGFTPALINLAFIHFRQQQWQQALNCFERLEAANSTDPLLLFALADTYSQLNQREQAVACFRRYLELDPSDSQAATIRLAELGAGTVPEQHPHDMTREVYRNKAANWDSDIQRNDNRYFGPELIEQCIQSLPGPLANLRILDLGCGTGLCGHYLRPAASYLVGVDLSPDMLTIAKQKALYHQLVEADLQQFLNACNEQFDLVTAAGVFILFGDLEKPLREIARLLSPGGHCAFTAYRSEQGDISVRHNRHFAHSRDYIERCAVGVGLDVRTIDEVVHETESGVAQMGYAVVLQSPPR